jgi:uncharacterized damage-inducible protein DinB
MVSDTEPVPPDPGHPADPTRPPPSEAPPALAIPRPDEQAPADEMTMARNWLRYLRRCAVFKLADLDDHQLRWRPAPTANSLGALVVHLGYAERLWLRAIYAGEAMDMGWRAHMFELPEGWGHDQIVSFYEAEAAAADAVLDAAESFDLASRGEFRPTTLRWVVVHLIEETARHLGHMDITRELLDGRTGR